MDSAADQTNVIRVSAAMTAETPSATKLVPTAAKVTDAAALFIRMTISPSNRPAVMRMPVTAPPLSTSFMIPVVGRVTVLPLVNVWAAVTGL